MEFKTKDYLKFAILLIEFSALISTIIWIKRDTEGTEPFVAFLVALGAFITTLLTIKFLNERNPNPGTIQAKVIEHLSEERRAEFNKLRQNITKGDEIWILGTGVTSFLNDRENLEIYLKNGARIKILMINDKLLKNSKECNSDILYNMPDKDKKEIEKALICDIENCNFMIRKKHFDKYFQRNGYHERYI